jgi:hypothetical protein
VFSAGESVTGGSADSINNVEQVHLSAPTLGSWTVRVVGTAVNNGPQGYALIATGEITQTCSSHADCDDLFPCTIDTCDASGECTYAANPGAGCDDGSVCTFDDTCAANGQCVGTEIVVAVDCDDGEQCTEDTCNPIDGCRNRAMPGMICDDGNACTIADTCQDGTTCSGVVFNPLTVCQDNNNCTDEICDEAIGCVNAPKIGFACNDADDCTVDDACDETGTCTGTQLVILFGDVQSPFGAIDLDDILYLLSAFTEPDACSVAPDANIFPCDQPCAASAVDLDDILAILAAFSSNPPCPDECPLP